MTEETIRERSEKFAREIYFNGNYLSRLLNAEYEIYGVCDRWGGYPYKESTEERVTEEGLKYRITYFHDTFGVIRLKDIQFEFKGDQWGFTGAHFLAESKKTSTAPTPIKITKFDIDLAAARSQDSLK